MKLILKCFFLKIWLAKRNLWLKRIDTRHISHCKKSTRDTLNWLKSRHGDSRVILATHVDPYICTVVCKVSETNFVVLWSFHPPQPAVSPSLPPTHIFPCVYIVWFLEYVVNKLSIFKFFNFFLHYRKHDLLYPALYYDHKILKLTFQGRDRKSWFLVHWSRSLHKLPIWADWEPLLFSQATWRLSSFFHSKSRALTKSWNLEKPFDQLKISLAETCSTAPASQQPSG